MKKYNMNDFENMMINILQEGHVEIWKSLEEIKNPLERCEARRIFADAMKKINDNKL